MDGTENTSARLAPLLLAALAAAAAEGTVAAVYAATLSAGFFAAVHAFVSGATVVLAVLAPPAVLAGWIAGRAPVRALGRGLRAGLSGGEPGSAAAALAAGAAVLGGSVAVTGLIGGAVAESMTPRFFVFLEALVFAAVLFVLVVVAPLATSRLLAPARRLCARWPDWAATIVVFTAAAAAVLTVLLVFLPREYAASPTAALLGFAWGLVPAVRTRLGALLRGRRAPIAAAILVVCSAAGLASLELAAVGTRQALLFRAPYTGILLGIAHKVADRDRDGYSPILLGGDCDDSNPRVNPGAADIPGNHLDEDCSGADAAAYKPRKRPSFPRPAALGERPNIVLILVDAVRPDHLGLRGYERKTSPRIDAFRESATWFEKAYTPAPVTQSAMLSLFTGYDFRRMPRTYTGYKRYKVLPSARTVAESLKKAGYDTLGYTISYVLLSADGLGQGFRIWKSPWPVKSWRKAKRTGATMTTDAAIAQLAKTPDDGSKPFFLFAHYHSAHAPYYKYEKWDFGDRDVDRYDSSVAYCDAEAGRLVDALDARADKDRTAVIIFSDHGEMFGDHGLTDHGRSLYEADVRVLLLARVPGSRARTVESPVSVTDLADTVLELGGLAAPKGGDGQSLLPYMFRGYEEMDRPIFLFTELKQGAIEYDASAVLSWPLKYIRDKRAHTEELFDVASDPGEKRNLVDEKPDARRSLGQLLDSFDAYANRKKR